MNTNYPKEMKTKLLIIVINLLLFLSCTSDKNKSRTQKGITKKMGKLEQLLLLSKDSLICNYDLSNDSIKEFPNLSEYRIKSLNLSHNSLDTLIVDYLPKEIISINLSHNKLSNTLILNSGVLDSLAFKFREISYSEATIKEIDLSYNLIEELISFYKLRKLIISHNNLKYLDLSSSQLEYLDISYNPNLNNVFSFPLSKIDTIKRIGISNNKELKTRIGPGRISCTITISNPDTIK